MEGQEWSAHPDRRTFNCPNGQVAELRIVETFENRESNIRMIIRLEAHKPDFITVDYDRTGNLARVSIYHHNYYPEPGTIGFMAAFLAETGVIEENNIPVNDRMQALLDQPQYDDPRIIFQKRADTGNWLAYYSPRRFDQIDDQETWVQLARSDQQFVLEWHGHHYAFEIVQSEGMISFITNVDEDMTQRISIPQGGFTVDGFLEIKKMYQQLKPIAEYLARLEIVRPS